MQDFNYLIPTTIVAKPLSGCYKTDIQILCVCAHAFIKHVYAFILHLCELVRRELCS